MRIGLIGFPVAHSASPRMQAAAFAAAGLDWTYELWNTPLEDLPARVRAIRDDDGIGGANVTIPHKLNVMPFLDEITPHARAIGAVNTIVKGAAGLSGDNTDWVGFLNDLKWHGVEPLAGQGALVLGAGGSARAIVYALARCGLHTSVLNRDAARAHRLVEALQPLFAGVQLRPFALNPQGLDAALGRRGAAATAEPRLIVNCTSAGMSPNVDTTPWVAGVAFPSAAVLYDLVYRPSSTLLMRQAQAAGLHAISGLGMLSEQGAVAFERWTAIPAAQVAGVMRAEIA